MTVVDLMLGVLAVIFLVVLWSLVAGPSDADRLVALDLGFVVFVAAVALLAVRQRAPWMLVLVLAATLVGFLATVAVAHLLDRRSR